MLIRYMNWNITLRRFERHYDPSTSAKYAQYPNKSHIKAALRVCGYFKAYAKGKDWY